MVLQMPSLPHATSNQTSDLPHMQKPIELLPEGADPIESYNRAAKAGLMLIERNNRLAIADHKPKGWMRWILVNNSGPEAA